MTNKIINLTPHVINILSGNIVPSGTVARVTEIATSAGQFDGIELVHKAYGDVIDLPEPKKGVLYIVSAMVRLALPTRTDLASPGDQIRNSSGQIVGVKNLVIN